MIRNDGTSLLYYLDTQNPQHQAKTKQYLKVHDGEGSG